MTDRTRLQVEMAPETAASLQRILDTTHLTTQAQAVRIAIELLDSVLQDERAGAKILVDKPGEPLERLRFLF